MAVMLSVPQESWEIAQTPPNFEILAVDGEHFQEAVPMFNGSAEIGFLSLVIALAAFVRTLSMAAATDIETIQADPKSRVWPHTHAHTADLISNLRGTIRAVSRITRYLLFPLILCAAARVVFHAYTLVFPLPSAPEILKVFDLFLVIFFFILTVGMLIAHGVFQPQQAVILQRKDDHVGDLSRTAALSQAAEIPTPLSGTVRTRSARRGIGVSRQRS